LSVAFASKKIEVVPEMLQKGQHRNGLSVLDISPFFSYFIQPLSGNKPIQRKKPLIIERFL